MVRACGLGHRSWHKCGAVRRCGLLASDQRSGLSGGLPCRVRQAWRVACPGPAFVRCDGATAHGTGALREAVADSFRPMAGRRAEGHSRGRWRTAGDPQISRDGIPRRRRRRARLSQNVRGLPSCPGAVPVAAIRYGRSPHRVRSGRQSEARQERIRRSPRPGPGRCNGGGHPCCRG